MLKRFSRIMARFKPPGRLLAVETDGFGFRVALLRAEGEKVRFERVIEADGDPKAALAGLRGRLQAFGTLPKEAILLTPAVIPALIDLPVASPRQRPYAQMQEMIRWEMEPFFVQRVGIWKLGLILSRRGHLTKERMQEILEEMARRKEEPRSAWGERTVSSLFGEVAVERGYITPAQRDEALTIQRQFQTTDDEMVCGWSPQPPPPGPAKEAGMKPGKSPWLVCGMSRSERERWVELFHRHGFSLRGIYPLIGCSAAAVNGAASSASALVEVRAGVVGCVRFSGNRVASMQLYYSIDRPLSEEVPPVWVVGETAALGLAGEDHLIRSLPEGFPTLPSHGPANEAAARENRFIPVEVEPSSLPRGLSAASLSGILGAARHAWGLPGASRAVCVPARDPGPPLRQRPSVWWRAAGLAAILILAGLELSLSLRGASARARFTEASRALKALKDENAAVLERRETLKKVYGSIKEKRKEMEEAAGRRTLLETELPARTGRILSFLDRVTGALPEEMAIERIAEEGEEVLISGWAGAERTIQQFALRLASAIAPLGLKIVGLEVSDEKEGFHRHRALFRLAPPPSVPAAAAPAAAAAPPAPAGRRPQ